MAEMSSDDALWRSFCPDNSGDGTAHAVPAPGRVWKTRYMGWLRPNLRQYARSQQGYSALVASDQTVRVTIAGDQSALAVPRSHFRSEEELSISSSCVCSLVTTMTATTTTTRCGKNAPVGPFLEWSDAGLLRAHDQREFRKQDGQRSRSRAARTFADLGMSPPPQLPLARS